MSKRVTLDEAIALSGLSRSTLLTRIQRGDLKAVSVKRRWYIDTTSLAAQRKDTRGRKPLPQSVQRIKALASTWAAKEVVQTN